jgi:hypothetical protein
MQIDSKQTKAMVLEHDTAARKVLLQPAFAGFCNNWGLEGQACKRARTKGMVQLRLGQVAMRLDSLVTQNHDLLAHSAKVALPPDPIETPVAQAAAEAAEGPSPPPNEALKLRA